MSMRTAPPRESRSVDGVRVTESELTIEGVIVGCAALRFESGVAAIYGVNGAGKSTTLNGIRAAIEGSGEDLVLRVRQAAARPLGGKREFRMVLFNSGMSYRTDSDAAIRAAQAD